jgi:hypothetical protein
MTNFVLIYKTGLFKHVKQEVNSSVILPPLVFPALPFRRTNEPANEYHLLSHAILLLSLTMSLVHWAVTLSLHMS